jgi:predicted ATPase
LIRRISIEGFKSFKKTSVELGNVNILIGSNASGKSNFLEALRILQGLAVGVPIKDIFDGSPSSSSKAGWEPIRGGSHSAAYREGGDRRSPPVDAIHFHIEVSSGGQTVTYSATFSEPPHYLRREVFVVGTAKVFEIRSTGQFCLYYADPDSDPVTLPFDPLRSAISQIAKYPQCLPQHLKLISDCVSDLSEMQHLDPHPEVLRRYSEQDTVSRMGERGENFAALVNAIEDKESYLRWLQLTVSEFHRVEIMRGALNEPLFAIEQKQRLFAAPQLSDGTLRFAALTAAFFQPSMPRVLLLDEIERAIHPARLHSLIDLIKSQSERCQVQVIATTHSPVVLAWLNESDYSCVLLFQSDAETGESRITPVSKLPQFVELARRQSIADMFAEGWMEAVS